MFRSETMWPWPSSEPVKPAPEAKLPTGMKPVVPQTSWAPLAVPAALKLEPRV
ncbi:hypothetical protein D3C78_1899390 [compost metagenome]